MYYESETGDYAALNDSYRSKCPIDLGTMTTSRSSKSPIKGTAINKEYYQQTRVEIINKDANGDDINTLPTWLQSPSGILSNTTNGYDSSKGSYSDIPGFLNTNANIVHYNGKAQNKVTLSKRSGTGGTSVVYPFNGYQMQTIEVPTRANYTFGGYWTDSNGTGTQYYNADGTSTRTWNKTADTTLYAKWTAAT